MLWPYSDTLTHAVMDDGSRAQINLEQVSMLLCFEFNPVAFYFSSRTQFALPLQHDNYEYAVRISHSPLLASKSAL